MLDELYTYWSKQPPEHELAYALFQGMGGKRAGASNMPPAPEGAKVAAEFGFNQLLGELGGCGRGERVKITLPPAPVKHAR
jgi:hypothetical protein